MLASRNAFARSKSAFWMSRSSFVDVRRGAGERHAELLALLAGHVAPGDHAGALLQVLRPELDAHRHAAQLALGEAEARLTCRTSCRPSPRAARSRRTRRAAGRAAPPPASPPRRCTAARSASFLPSGQMTTWIGASRGGTTRPLSSECVMIRPPISRVETPQLVAQAYSSLSSSFWNCHVERLGEVLPEEVARARLQRLAVLHHRLDAERVDRAGELLPLALRARPAPASPSTPRRTCGTPRPSAASPPRPPSAWRGRCGPPARGTRRCAGTAASASPSGRRCTTG